MKVLTTTLMTVKEMQTKHIKLLHSNVSKKETQLRQEILAFETFVRWWPVQGMGRSGQYSKYFNGPNSGSGSTYSATASMLLCELLKETLDGLAMGKSPDNQCVVKGTIIERVGEDIYM